MSADLRELFDQAGWNPPDDRALDVDTVLRRARASHHRRVAGAVAAAVAVTVALGVGLASQQNRTAAPAPAPPVPTAPTSGSLGRLAFGLHGDVYLADWDGENRVRIADGTPETQNECLSYWSEGPVWSPDGRYFTYRGSAENGNDSTGCPSSPTVNISDPSGHRIASFPGSGWQVAWSPDSTRVAVWVDFGSTLGIYGLDGERQALLTAPAGGMPGDFDPVWSPDGGSLLLRGGVEVPIDGSTPRQLPSDDPRSQLAFAYSPDGADIAYISQDGLAVAAADGSQARVMVPTGIALTESLWLGPVWSPTGDRIAFVSKSGGEPAGKGRVKELVVLDVASGTVSPLADHVDVPGSILEFSPKGDQILFTRSDAIGAPSVWSVHTDGSDLHRLVAGSDWGDWQTLPPRR